MTDSPKLPARPGSPLLSALKKSGEKASLEASKFLASYATAGDGQSMTGATIGLAVGGVSALIEGIREYGAQKRELNAYQCLVSFHEQLRDNEKARGALQRETKPMDPLVDVFLSGLHLASEDDEELKSDLYAAFMVGLMDDQGRLNPSVRVSLFDTMKKLRVHDLLTLRLLIDAQRGQVAVMEPAFISPEDGADEEGPQDPRVLPWANLGMIESIMKQRTHGIVDDLVIQSLQVIVALGQGVTEFTPNFRRTIAGKSEEGPWYAASPLAVHLVDMLEPGFHRIIRNSGPSKKVQDGQATE
jgi:hypothetical protein